jgi:hypothetical protein
MRAERRETEVAVMPGMPNQARRTFADEAIHHEAANRIRPRCDSAAGVIPAILRPPFGHTYGSVARQRARQLR